MDLPPQAVTPPSYKAEAPECRYLTREEALVALTRLRGSLPSTDFQGARPSEICGLVRVQLSSGKVAYTDPTGRYFMLMFALDTHKGEPADNADQIERAISSRETLPEIPVPGLVPSLDPEAPLMSPIPAAR